MRELRASEAVDMASALIAGPAAYWPELIALEIGDRCTMGAHATALVYALPDGMLWRGESVYVRPSVWWRAVFARAR